MSGLWQWWRCVACGTMTNDDRALSELMCDAHLSRIVQGRPSGPLVLHDWQKMPPKAETREQRTIRRLRALANGYRARVLTIEDAASAAERACIVAWLRRAAVTFVEKLPPEDAFHDEHTDLIRDAFLDAADQLESEP